MPSMMPSGEIRERYLRFFAGKGHRLVPSASLVPEDDPTLLFTTAGMAQFKDAFLGRGKRDYTRATSCQKCLRVGDIDRVGRTAFHHTFFEMLGNFSFGDYFKAEAIPWAWELLVQEFRIAESRLQVTVFREDEEARGIWEKAVGLPRARVHGLGEADNFWPANAPAEGPNGPCGPCSEIYYDRGEAFGCGRSDCGPACACGRWFEVWNLVFTQYDRRDGGVLEPLPRKNIDTGMGMERITSVLQGVPTSFDTDLVAPIVRGVAEVADRRYEPETESGVRMRRIADHVRALAFCITDGVLPANEGRGYVLRRLLRRAARDGRELGLDRPFLAALLPPVIKAMGKAYPELAERKATLAQVLTSEEERFQAALVQGTEILQGTVREMRSRGQSVLDGETAFRLYDTYGFPLDLVEHILADEKMTVDRAAFETALGRQREQSRDSSSMKGDVFALGPVKELLTRVERTEFLGYKTTAVRAKVLGFVLEDKLVSALEQGLQGAVVLDRSPFYAESGGQVGDTGELLGPRGRFRITDTQAQDGLFLHAGVMEEGRLAVGDEVSAKVDRKRRASIMRHHTATHLLHAALKKVLGPHVEQAGSLVAPHVLRFDFRHPKPMTAEEIQKTVNLVNRQVLRNVPVTKEVQALAAAKAGGATALFGEKYGDEVRVVTVEGFSKELCGGIHCRRSGDIGAFWILSERAVGAGLRRIEAVAGARSVALIRDRERALKTVAAALKSTPEEASVRAADLMEEVRQLRRENDKLRQERFQGQAAGSESGPIVEGRVVWKNLGKGVSVVELKQAADALKARYPDAVVLLGAEDGEKANLVFSAAATAITQVIPMNALMQASAPAVLGKGGGRADFAQGGGPKVDGIDEALRIAREQANTKLGQPP